MKLSIAFITIITLANADARHLKGKKGGGKGKKCPKKTYSEKNKGKK